MPRGQQRRIYDQRRRELIPEHNLRLIVIAASALACDRRGRLLRDRAGDKVALRGLLAQAADAPS